MTEIRWRRAAKELLYNYTTNRKILRMCENDILFSARNEHDHCYRRGGVANPTLMKAQKLDSSEIRRLKKEIAAVEAYLATLDTHRRIDLLRCRMLEMVYFRGSHSLIGAACVLEIGERTAKRWNSHALAAVAQAMGWQNDKNKRINEDIED